MNEGRSKVGLDRRESAEVTSLPHKSYTQERTRGRSLTRFTDAAKRCSTNTSSHAGYTNEHVRGAGRRGEQLEHHKKASEVMCPAELDTVKHSEVMGTGEKAVRERGGDHQRTSLAQERHKGSAWGRGSTPRSPCASKTGDLHGAEIKGVPRAPLYLELPDVQAEGGLEEIIACTHAQTGANTRIRTHDRGEHTRSNPRGDKGNDRVPALSTSSFRGPARQRLVLFRAR